jgi:hypothetical protein
MDRIEAYEDFIEEESRATLKPLKLDMSRFQVKKVSNPEHAKRTLLAEQMSRVFGKPIPRLMKLIKPYKYTDVFDAFEQVKKAKDVRNQWGLFLWKLKNSQG